MQGEFDKAQTRWFEDTEKWAGRVGVALWVATFLLLLLMVVWGSGFQNVYDYLIDPPFLAAVTRAQMYQAADWFLAGGAVLTLVVLVLLCVRRHH